MMRQIIHVFVIRNVRWAAAITAVITALFASPTLADDALIRQLLMLNMNAALIEHCGFGKDTAYHRDLLDILRTVESYASSEDVNGTREAPKRLGINCSKDSIHVIRLLRAMANYEATRN
jgi:hypothetical protein